MWQIVRKGGKKSTVIKAILHRLKSTAIRLHSHLPVAHTGDYYHPKQVLRKRKKIR